MTIAAQTVAVTPGGIGGVRGGGDRGAGRRSAPAPARRWPPRWSRTRPRPAYALVVGGVGAGRAGPGVLRPAAAGPRAAAAAAGAAGRAGRAGGRDDPGARRGRRPSATWCAGCPPVACGRPVRTARRGRRVHRRLGRAWPPRPAPPWSPSRATSASAPPCAGRWPRPARCDPACVVYLDADGEYCPRGAGSCSPRRCWPGGPTTWSAPGSPAASGGCGRTGRLGNRVLTRWVRWTDPPPRPHRRAERLPGLLPGGRRRRPRSCTTTTTPRCSPSTCSARATSYAEVPITLRVPRPPAPRFVRLGTLPAQGRCPAVHRELNDPTPAQSSTTWAAKRARAAAHEAGSRVPSGRSARDRVVGLGDRVVGVVVREQPEPAERRDPVQRRRPTRPAAGAGRRSRSRRPGRRAAAGATSTPPSRTGGRPAGPQPVPDQLGQVVRRGRPHRDRRPRTGSPRTARCGRPGRPRLTR